jgi:hypothetical protein
MSDQTYIAAPAAELGWRYEVPKRTDAKVLLLTIGRIATIGNWSGPYGRDFIAWAPLPKRNKAEEARLGLLPAAPVDDNQENL